MMHCPKCFSSNVSSNKFSEENYKQVFHAGHVSQHGGYTLIAAGAMAIVGGMKIVDQLSHDWHCDNCGNKFS